jgi:hypothetical protein
LADRGLDRRKDPEYMRELAQKAVAARAKKKAARERGEIPFDPTAEVDPWEVLREIAGNKKVPAYSRTQAAKALQANPAPAAEAEWRNSVQVRADFEPPTWEEIGAVARAAGAIL